MASAARSGARDGPSPTPAATSPASAAGPAGPTPRAAGCSAARRPGRHAGRFAEWCFGLFRTDPEAERHRGLTYFLIDLATPGVTVRPIPQIDGETGFAELFFEDVLVPDDQVLGDVGQGWNVAMATAGSERGLSLRSPARYTEAADRLVALYAERLATRPGAGRRASPTPWPGPGSTPRPTGSTPCGRPPGSSPGGSVGPEASANKIHWSETDLAIHRAALALLGPEAELHGGRWDAPWLDGFLFALAGPIYAGTNEIQRNVVAERMLGLPRG